MDIIQLLRFVATALLQQRQAMQDKLRDIEKTPAVTKPRRSRFSFSDVASSRVDPEGETGIEQLPEITEGPENPPPLQGGSAAFRKGTEEVVPAFVSPAFAESETEGDHSAESAQKTKAKTEDKRRQQSLSIPERRQHPRKQILLFTYAELGEDNGGLVFNLGEGGLALTAAATLHEHHFSKMRVRFPDSADWLETSGRLVWKNDSGKEAGIEFLDLPEDARVRIREWVSQGDSGGASSEDGIRASQSAAQELPSFMDPGLSATEFIEAPTSFEEQAFENKASGDDRFVEQTKTPAASSSALFKTGIQGASERASVRRRVAKVKPPRVPDHFVEPRTSVARKALSIAAGVALAAGVWMFFQRIPLNEASGIIAQILPNTRPSHKPTQTPGIAKSEVGAGGTAADRPVQSKETVVTQNGISTPSLQQIERAPTPNGSKIAITGPPSGSARAAKEKPPTKDALKYMGVDSSSAPRSEQGQHPAAPSQSEQKTESPRLRASAPASWPENKPVENNAVESKPTESKPVQIAQAFPAQNKDLNTTSPSPGTGPSQPAAAPPADLEKEKSPVAPKLPEPVLARTPVVTVSFDPFPSIRMPKNEKSKKSHQGKNLQMGRLLSRVDPVYPEEAKEQGIEGTVRVHAIFNREGSVQSVISVSGPPLLALAAINAVRQWRYSQTILGGQAMETEEDVTVLFRLASSPAKN